MLDTKKEKNKMKNLTYVIYTCTVILAFSCKKPDLSNITEGTVTDNSGNTYKTVELGDQVWMAENLKTIKFSNGDSIKETANDSLWKLGGNDIYCPVTYGNLYNYQTAINVKNICPSGWHIPTDDDWDELIDFLGGKYEAGALLKDVDQNSWFLTSDPEPLATNESLFSALAPGYRNKVGAYNNARFFAYFWTSTLDKSDSVIVKSMHYGSRAVSTILMDQKDGASIRCVQD